MTKPAIDIWPRPRLRRRAWIPISDGLVRVERQFEHLYPGSNSVIFPSARSALAALMGYLELSRADLVWSPRFSSHCVIDAIGRTATPSPCFAPEALSAILLSHQWGYPHTLPAAMSIPVIEDSADTLIEPGTGLFAQGGRFELVSLPKILGCLSGGVLFCRDEADAEAVRQSHTRGGHLSTLQFLLRLATRSSHAALIYWLGAEAENRHVPGPVIHDIMLALEDLGMVIEDRKRKLALIRSCAPRWLNLASGRLPSNMPIPFDPNLLSELLERGYPVDARHFNAGCSIDDSKWVKVIRVPLHQDMPAELIVRIAEMAAG